MVTARHPIKRYIRRHSLILLGMFFATHFILFIAHEWNCQVRINKIKDEYHNQFMAYEYLNKYHCWWEVFETTQYTLDPAECSKNKKHKYYGLTYSGTRARKDWTIAVDPKVVKLGSILIDIKTGSKYIAEDTGNAIKGRKIDIFVGEGTKNNIYRARRWGRQKRLFIVIETPNKYAVK